jgi:drug/metabolite transporter (DMT)-like permease
MERKDRMDMSGAAALVGFALVLAVNQVVIKLTNGGIGPVFLAALRSVGAVVVLLVWMRWRGIRLEMPPGTGWAGVLAGLFFAGEFICLFLALDMTTVSRASIIFYSMPVHLTIAGHFLIPGERMTRSKLAGLALAMGGVIWVMFDRSNGRASLMGDVLALGAALGWAAIALTVRITPLARVRPEQQLIWQVSVSAVVLLAVAPLFGDLLRGPNVGHWAGLVFQIFAVASFGFLFWFSLMKKYPAASVASFSFLTPVFSVMLGWLVLGEHIGGEVIGGLCLVALGLVLINRGPRKAG